jgi:hypothetical protein
MRTAYLVQCRGAVGVAVVAARDHHAPILQHAGLCAQGQSSYVKKQSFKGQIRVNIC